MLTEDIVHRTSIDRDFSIFNENHEVIYLYTYIEVSVLVAVTLYKRVARICLNSKVTASTNNSKNYK